MAASFKLNTKEFDRTLRKYVETSSRTIPVIVNTKAYYIARRAVAETPMAETKGIRSFFHRNARVPGMIINKKRGERGEKGLYGKEMEMAIKTMLASRLRARAFVKSGWLWAVKKLAPYAERISGPSLGMGRPKAVGKPKGSAEPANTSAGWRCRAKIINTVTAAWDTRNNVENIATPALQRAFNFERQSMIAYMERKLKHAARRSGIKIK